MAKLLTVDKCENCGGKLVADYQTETVRCTKCGQEISFLYYEHHYSRPES